MKYNVKTIYFPIFQCYDLLMNKKMKIHKEITYL